MKKILNVGIQLGYDEGLIRKIRISNLIAIISIITMLGFYPMSFYLNYSSALILITFFTLASISNFVLHHYKKHLIAFLSFSIAGYVYFFFATILFGLNSNIHYFYLVMCMIAAVIFDKKWLLNVYIISAIVLFFFLLWFMKGRSGIIVDTPELIEIQEYVGYVIVFLLFIITSIFFIFFKTENSNFQKAIIAQKHIIEEKHREITDSINYAERIQRSFLATKELLDENLGVSSSVSPKDDVSRSEPGYFVFFKPKDVVSGDFYFASRLNNSNFAFCCADSTGHGVPGAIMSILNISSLEKAIEKENEPHHILGKTREFIINRLQKDGSPKGGKDGMDCSLLVLNQDKSQLTFASANNPVFIVREVNPEATVPRSDMHEFIEFKPDKMPVGKHDKDQVPFTLQTVILQKGDVIYTLTDGFPDQFGGDKGKKYMIKNLKELFLSIAHLPMKEQELLLDKEFANWKGNHEQIDDVCIIGVRV